MARNPLNPRFAMLLAGAPPVHRASMSTSVAHGSTVCRICAWGRFWDAAHDGSLVREDPRKTQVEMARNITTLPMRMGGLGLRSVRTAPASRADALPMLQQRLPRLLGQLVHHLSHPVSRLDRDGPSLVLVGRCCDEVSDLDLFSNRGAWRVASRLAVQFVFWFRTPFSGDGCACPVVCCRPGPFAITLWTTCQPGVARAPTPAEFCVKPLLFARLVLERLRLPLSITEARCECGRDFRGQHCAACPRSGLLRSRAVPTERTLARVCCEAGATVRRNAKLRDMNGQSKCWLLDWS